MSWGIFLENKSTTELYEMRKQLEDKLAQTREDLINVDREIQRRSVELMEELIRGTQKKERTIQEMIESEKERLENIKGIIINIEEPEGGKEE